MGFGQAETSVVKLESASQAANIVAEEAKTHGVDSLTLKGFRETAFGAGLGR